MDAVVLLPGQGERIEAGAITTTMKATADTTGGAFSLSEGTIPAGEWPAPARAPPDHRHLLRARGDPACDRRRPRARRARRELHLGAPGGRAHVRQHQRRGGAGPRPQRPGGWGATCASSPARCARARSRGPQRSRSSSRSTTSWSGPRAGPGQLGEGSGASGERRPRAGAGPRASSSADRSARWPARRVPVVAPSGRGLRLAQRGAPAPPSSWPGPGRCRAGPGRDPPGRPRPGAVGRGRARAPRRPAGRWSSG